MKPRSTDEKLANDLIGIAGVHFVAYKLSLRGLIALPTIRNTAGVDLLVSDPRSRLDAVLQVKTSMKRARFWPTSRFDRCLRGPGTHYAFLRYLKEREDFEVFLEEGDRVAAQVEQNARDYETRGRKEFAFWRLPADEVEQDRLRAEWERWRPGKTRSRSRGDGA